MAQALLIVAASATPAMAGAWSRELSGSTDPQTTYNYLALGDWGDDSAGQRAAAAGMGVVAAEIDATQVFALGDNFYHSAYSHCSNSGICPNNSDGIDGAVRFNQTFESMYTAGSLLDIPFYAIAGK